MKNNIKEFLLISNYDQFTREELSIYSELIKNEIDKIKCITLNNTSSIIKLKNIQRKTNLCMFFNIIKELENKLNIINNILNK
jgi:hypothetical protein